MTLTDKLIACDNKLPRKMKLIRLDILKTRKSELLAGYLASGKHSDAIQGRQDSLASLNQRIKNLQRKLIIY